ncbi:MAG: hypothetical protein ACRDSR_21945 [Pseudonocardiaceae bacterium]
MTSPVPRCPPLCWSGDLETRRARTAAGDFGPLQAYGQVRLVGAQVHGSASLSGARLHGPGLDVLFADRLRVGGSLFLRGMVATGSIRLHHADIGSTLDCTGAQLDAPRCRADGSIKPSLDARAATIGKDVYASRGFTATGGVRLSLAEVSKSVSLDGARLGGPGAPVGRSRGGRRRGLPLPGTHRIARRGRRHPAALVANRAARLRP